MDLRPPPPPGLFDHGNEATLKRKRSSGLKRGGVFASALGQFPGTPGEYGWEVLTTNDPTGKSKNLSVVLANGRLDMRAIIGMFSGWPHRVRLGRLIHVYGLNLVRLRERVG